MKKKYNDKSLVFADWTTKKLKEEAISYDEIINVTQCYGTNDVINFAGICNELGKRKINITKRLTFN